MNAREKAIALIESEDDICYDVAADQGQKFHNVKHMEWFVDAVMEELEYRGESDVDGLDDDFVVTLDDEDVGLMSEMDYY